MVGFVGLVAYFFRFFGALRIYKKQTVPQSVSRPKKDVSPANLGVRKGLGRGGGGRMANRRRAVPWLVRGLKGHLEEVGRDLIRRLDMGLDRGIK